VMATRSGSVDPGLLLWLLERTGIREGEMAHALEHESGLAALAGTDEMPAVVAAAQAGEQDARLALDVYLHRLSSGVAAIAAAMGGLDALAFTGGVGENAAVVRAGAGERLGFLGIEVDRERNEGVDADADVSAPEASVRTLVIKAREDLEIARQVREVLKGS
jgi:acetate kinase